MTQVEVEIFRDSEIELRDKLNTLYQLLPKEVQVTITESSIPFPLENNPATISAKLLSFEMQRLTENRHYRARYISTTSIDKVRLIELLEIAGFVVIQQFNEAERG